MKRSNYKYICTDCGESTFFNRLERTRAGGLHCRFCGSRHVEPSKDSWARDMIDIAQDAKKDQDKRLEKLQNLKHNHQG